VLANLSRAKRWLKWLQDEHADDAVIAPYLTWCELYDDADAEQRARGLRRSLLAMTRCDELVLCGGRMSAGMQREKGSAITGRIAVTDLLGLGEEPPR
jgi:hypothetical protein